MAHARTLGFAAAGAAALVLAPLPALAAEDADASTGTLTVTFFEDRYADGLFDPSTSAPNGAAERKRTDLPLNLIDVNGTRHYESANAAGDYVFEDVPVGPAQVHFPDPNAYRSVAFFDATGATSAADLERLPGGEYFGLTGVLTVEVDADGEFRLVGMTALRLVADVRLPDGSPAAGVSVELGSNGEFSAATEYSFRPGSYEAFDAFPLPGDLGLRVTAPAGYRVASVVAGNSAGGDELPVTERDGVWYFASTGVADYFWNPTFTVALAEVPDTTRPEVVLVSPTTAGPFPALDIRVDATDDRGLQRIVANVYRDGTLVKSTQTRVEGGATSGSHTATVSLPDGTYTVKYNAQDLAGNISRTSTVTVRLDATAPRATVKSGSPYTVGDTDGYDVVSFKLYDAGKIAQVEINGVVKDLTDNTWSDVNFIRPGVFGARVGANTMVVTDVAGNSATYEFVLN